MCSSPVDAIGSGSSDLDLRKPPILSSLKRLCYTFVFIGISEESLN